MSPKFYLTLTKEQKKLSLRKNINFLFTLLYIYIYIDCIKKLRLIVCDCDYKCDAHFPSAR